MWPGNICLILSEQWGTPFPFSGCVSVCARACVFPIWIKIVLLSSNIFHAIGGDNSSDTESAPSPSQADSSKSGDTKRVESRAGDSQCPDQDRSQASSGKALELPYSELRVKEEKSPESESQSQEAKVASFTASIHPKTELQDMDMKAGEVQVKLEPEVKERGEKAEHGGRDHHSDNDSSATCSADEDVEAEPERRYAFITAACIFFIVYRWMRYFSYVFDKFLFGSAEYWLKSLLYLTLLAQCWCPHPNKPNSTSSNCKNGQLQSHQWLISSTSFVSPSSKEFF